MSAEPVPADAWNFNIMIRDLTSDLVSTYQVQDEDLADFLTLMMDAGHLITIMSRTPAHEPAEAEPVGYMELTPDGFNLHLYADEEK